MGEFYPNQDDSATLFDPFGVGVFEGHSPRLARIESIKTQRQC